MSNIIKNATYNYDYLNPLKGDNPDWDYIPGFRGADQLNIYTYDYLLKTKDNKTGTNPWGSEAAVNKNNIKTLNCFFIFVVNISFFFSW